MVYSASVLEVPAVGYPLDIKMLLLVRRFPTKIRKNESLPFIVDSSDFSLPVPTRISLSEILIVHPIACFLTLICLILAVISHFHSPAHSSRYLLMLIILLVPTLLITLLAFLVDILLFAPHQAWGTWIVLAATILIAIADGLTCCMRRTLVSRKARKKRIAENAEMSGENFYNRQAIAPPAPPPLNQQPVAPMVNGAPGADNLPSFATFDKKANMATEDDLTPLNSRSATAVSGSTGMPQAMESDGLERYGMGAGRGNGSAMGKGGRWPDQPPYGSEASMIGGNQDQGPQRMPSNEYMGGPGARGRGRGGYPPGNFRGGPYNGRGGPMNGRGDFGGRGRGPPPGYNRRGPPGPPGGPVDQYGRSIPVGFVAGAARGPPQRRQSPGPPSAPGYGRQPSPGPPSAPGYGRQPSPGTQFAPGPYSHGQQGYSDELARAESPPPLPGYHDPSTIGQAIEMDEHTGSPAPTPGFPPPNNPLRDSDSDLQGLVGLQQNRGMVPPISHMSSSSSQQE
jgi:hypothetical protein